MLSQAVGLKLTSQEVRPTDGRAGRSGEFWGTAEGAFWCLGTTGPWASRPEVAVSLARQVWATCMPRGSWLSLQ